MKEETELVVELRNDGSGLLVQYPRIKGRRGRLEPETLLQQLSRLLAGLRVWPGRWNRVISVQEGVRTG